MSVSQYTFTLPAFARGIHIITRHIEEAVGEWSRAGLCHIFIRHTSAALAINENADADVRKDMEYFLSRIAPEGDPNYRHTSEGADDMPAHLKAVMLGSSLSIPVRNGRLDLGTWQGIYLCEFRNQGGRRQLTVTVIS